MAEEMAPAKPQCGGGGLGEAEYDLPLHVAALFLVLFASCLGAGFPVVAKKVKWMKIPPKIFFFCKHFGTGVLIATAFVHLLPTAFLSLHDPCLPDLFIEDYPPLPGVIMMASLFLLFVVEMWLNGKTGGHSHGGPTGQNIIPPTHAVTTAFAVQPRQPYSRADSYTSEHTLHDDDKIATVKEYPVDKTDAEMPAWFSVFYDQYTRQRDEMLTILSRAVPAIAPAHTESVTETSYFESDPEQQGEVDPAVLKKMSLNITMLEGGILFHSVFVGMTVSITTDGFVILLIAILFHQMFEGLGLGSRIAAVPYPKKSWRPWILVVAFGTTAPIGQAIGLASRSSYDPNSAFGLIIVGVFNAISSGLLIYASLVDLLAEDFLSEEARITLTKKDKIVAFIFVLLGALGMSIVGAFA